MPDWYPLSRAARFWGVPPWELAARPAYWVELAQIIEAAEAKGAENRRKLGKL